MDVLKLLFYFKCKRMEKRVEDQRMKTFALFWQYQRNYRLIWQKKASGHKTLEDNLTHTVNCVRRSTVKTF